MPNEEADKKLLLQKLETLLAKQSFFANEINELKNEIYTLSNKSYSSQAYQNKIEEKPKEATAPIVPIVWQPKKQLQSPIETITYNKPIASPRPIIQHNKPKPISNLSIEKFIGENLISKIGIIITVIGVAIGAKYSIDRELISPVTRIILGYLMGIGLLGLGFYLKKKYTNYSAVLVSGAMAIMYFITYAAYSFYHLFPLPTAFTLMVIFTLCTVYLAINYNNKIIALFGLVGAYAIPFLLSTGDGNVLILYSYMAIINIGILAISVQKYWKLLYFVSFGLTWLIFITWFVFSYDANKHFAIAFVFACIFFAIFYIIFLAYKLIKKEKFGGGDVAMLLLNSFIFYVLGFYILESNGYSNNHLGLFTFCNALIHFIVSRIIHTNKLADKNLMYLIKGLALVFTTIIFPVVFDGNWVTLFWAGEAALLYWIGVSKNVFAYEKLSYPLMVLAFTSLIQDWAVQSNWNNFDVVHKITPFINIHFLSGIIFITSFSIINYYKHRRSTNTPFAKDSFWNSIINYGIPLVLILSTYYTFQLEIETYFNQLYANSQVSRGLFSTAVSGNENILTYRSMWTINYSLFFITILSYINIKKIKSKKLGVVNIAINAFFIITFLVMALPELNQLKENYLHNLYAVNIFIRYISYGFVALLFITTYVYIKQEFMLPIDNIIKVVLECLLYASILWVATEELIMYIQFGKNTQSNKLGVTILWGVYAMLLIFLGIWKKKIYLRIMGFIIFAITLLKLFLYDIVHLDTISKTIVFVSLGVLLLAISFIYNKYKKIIFDEGY
jgi:uncharacterized membrane protein